jgi:8-oxo-dGTP pyrophosphatase MutT (NUDIX family)
MERHFTVSGFVVEGDRTLLHWHRKLQIWLPPGGHIDPDEDMTQAVVREVLEETGIAAEIVPAMPLAPFSNLTQLPPPLAIIVADVGEGPHQHIDMSYALRERAGVARVAAEKDHGFIWVSAEQLRRDEALPVASCGVEVPIAEDVRVIGLRAIEVVRSAAG